MNMEISNSSRISKILYILTGFGIFAGLILTILSWSGACTEACNDSHSYRFFGVPFELIGILFFLLLITSYFLSRKYQIFATITALLLACGIGSEVMFILIQKYYIGAWCPICLGIATSIGIAAIASGIDYILKLRTVIIQGTRSDIMHGLSKSLTTLSAFTIGFLIAFFGVAKQDNLIAAEKTFEERVAFGQTKNTVDVYVFTSWVCPACRRFEPKLEEMMPKIMEKAQVVFVDYGVDDTTLNFLPYNLSFMLHNKENYLALRHMLKEMANDTEAPTDEEVEKAASKLGFKYKQLNYAEVALGIEYFKNLSTDLKVKSLPSFVIVNNSKKQTAMLTGSQISQAAVLKVVDEMKKKS